MNDGTLVVNFAALRHASEEIASAVGALHSRLDDLERAAAPLVASWDGAAKAAYDERQARWRRAAGDLSGMLDGIRRALDESVLDYADTEARNARLFQ